MKRKIQNRPASKRQQHLDQLLLEKHQQLFHALFSHPSLKQQCQQRLENMYQVGFVKHNAYVFWDSLLSSNLTEKDFWDALTNPSPQHCKYRRKSPCLWLLATANSSITLGRTELKPIN
ncbi:hypothetical protein [Alkalimonas amylolytica]|uniref:Uncharacterized protein n=1 Tax=Alkalimonas amylolytica TaxID=152573 RepID=A0A1H4BDL5_ALKAM|nr:hypothetical protein [Alkalimonas amylolytica]SEA46144.1 hypothetical protein SAMN04488051_103301 [Alkalimonas amylolytica]